MSELTGLHELVIERAPVVPQSRQREHRIAHFGSEPILRAEEQRLEHVEMQRVDVATEQSGVVGGPVDFTPRQVG